MSNYFTAFLRQLEVPFTPEYADSLFRSHPYRYTLFGLRSMLSHYSVKAEAVKFSDKSKALDDLSESTPFMVQLLNDIVSVTSVSEKIVEYSQYGNTVKITRESFIMLWTGVALVVTDVDSAAEPGYKTNRCLHFLRILEKYSAIMLGMLLVVAVGVWSGLYRNPWMLVQAICSATGTWFSVMLVAKSMKIDLSASNRLCRMIEGHDCHDVLSLPASKLFGRYGWSEIGVAYFITSFLLILIVPNASAKVIPWICIAALSYPIWSIWYQKYVAKKWCAICLAVQAVILIQGVLAIFQLLIRGIEPVGIHLTAIFIATYILAGLLVRFESHTISSAITRKQLEEDFSTFKFNSDVVEALFAKQPVAGELNSSVNFGSEDARFKITIFSNPYCPPCSKIHPKLEELYMAGCQITYCLGAFDSELMRTTEKLISYCQTHGSEDSWKILDAWYKGNKNESFFDDYDVGITDEARKEALLHKEWAEKNGMTGTPTILFDGKELPRHYNIDDIIFIVKNS